MKIGTQSDNVSVDSRIIGSYTKNQPGYLLLIFGGIHGNETSGVIALQEVFKHLEEHQPSFRGKIVGICGNMAAVSNGSRFIDKDLNRNWTSEHVEYLRKTPFALLDSSEDFEAKALIDIIDEELQSNFWKEKIFLDLHATSASGGGFLIIEDDPDNRSLAARLHMPLILGLETKETKLDSTLHHFLSEEMGLPGVIIESGQIGSKEAVEVHTSGLWKMISELGCIHPKDVPDYRRHVNRIIDIAENLPKAVQVMHRHAISTEDEYVTLPGFENFQLVRKGEHIGNDRNGPVYATLDGMVLMPLYQKLGSDGFFIVKPVDF
ncbi:MAG: succinylglutamate desuccinylase [Limisphaerales bacterium]|jgi:succinylglutamate desuccinylase